MIVLKADEGFGGPFVPMRGEPGQLEVEELTATGTGADVGRGTGKATEALVNDFFSLIFSK